MEEEGGDPRAGGPLGASQNHEPRLLLAQKNQKRPVSKDPTIARVLWRNNDERGKKIHTGFD